MIAATTAPITKPITMPSTLGLQRGASRPGSARLHARASVTSLAMNKPLSHPTSESASSTGNLRQLSDLPGAALLLCTVSGLVAAHRREESTTLCRILYYFCVSPNHYSSHQSLILALWFDISRSTIKWGAYPLTDLFDCTQSVTPTISAARAASDFGKCLALMCAEARGLPIIGCMVDLYRWKADISPLVQKHGNHFMLHAGTWNNASKGLFPSPMLAVCCHEDVMEIVSDKADVLVPIYPGMRP